MTISLRAVGTNSGAAGAVTGVSPGVPTGVTSSDISILSVEMKGNTAGVAPTVTTPTGWTLIGTVTNNGTLVAANDTGSNTVAMFYRIGTYTAPAVDTTGSNSTASVIVAYSGTVGYWDVATTTTGSDTSLGANGSIAGSSIASTTNAWLLCTAGLSGDLGSVTARTLTQASATIGTLQTRLELAVTTGNDSRLMVYDAPVTTGGTGVPTYTWTNTSSLTGHARFVVLKEIALPLPGTPTGFSAVSGPGKVTLSWTAADATQSTFAILRDGVEIATSTTSPYVDTTGVGGYEYIYSVKARNATGDSAATTGQAATASAGYEGTVAVTADDGAYSPGGTTPGATFTTSTSTFSPVGYSLAGGAWTRYARFTGVTIPKGATITSATLTLAASAYTGTPVTAIWGVAADNPAAPTDTTTFLALTKTSAKVSYAPPSNTISVTTGLTTGSLTTIVQEIVNRSGWASGNSMIMLIGNDGSSTAADNYWRMHDTFASTTYAPVLSITYTPLKYGSVTDDFSDGNATTGPFWSFSYGTVAETSGRLRTTSLTTGASGVQSADGYVLSESSLVVQVYPDMTTGAMTELTIESVTTGGTRMVFQIDGTNQIIVAQNQVGYFEDPATRVSTAFSGSMVWLRMREASSVTYFDYSLNGTSWTNLRSYASPAWVSGTSHLSMQVAQRTAGTTGTSWTEWDNLNLAPTATATVMRRVGKRRF